MLQGIQCKGTYGIRSTPNLSIQHLERWEGHKSSNTAGGLHECMFLVFYLVSQSCFFRFLFLVSCFWFLFYFFSCFFFFLFFCFLFLVYRLIVFLFFVSYFCFFPCFLFLYSYHFKSLEHHQTELHRYSSIFPNFGRRANSISQKLQKTRAICFASSRRDRDRCTCPLSSVLTFR